jgi:hypothetical protein
MAGILADAALLASLSTDTTAMASELAFAVSNYHCLCPGHPTCRKTLTPEERNDYDLLRTVLPPWLMPHWQWHHHACCAVPRCGACGAIFETDERLGVHQAHEHPNVRVRVARRHKPLYSYQ